MWVFYEHCRNYNCTGMLQGVVNCFLKVMRDTCKWNFFATLIIWPLSAVGCRQEVCGNIDRTVVRGFGGGVN